MMKTTLATIGFLAVTALTTFARADATMLFKVPGGAPFGGLKGTVVTSRVGDNVNIHVTFDSGDATPDMGLRFIVGHEGPALIITRKVGPLSVNKSQIDQTFAVTQLRGLPQSGPGVMLRIEAMNSPDDIRTLHQLISNPLPGAGDDAGPAFEISGSLYR
jgi:hypothetical protein